jgi:predicted secreted protein
VEVKSGDSYQPIDTSATYRVATNDFLARGGDGYTSFLEAGSTYNTGLVDYEVLHDYIQANSPLSPGIEGRINQTLTIVEVITMSIIDESFDGKEIEVPAGETFQVQLASNASTGFSWQLISISDSNVLEKVSNIYDTPMFKLKEGEPPPVGAGGVEFWDYKALKTGTSTIVMEYSQPWEGGTKAARQFTLTVTVK